MMKRVSGFTLIELLIVVAIIAILAAIAVPNFLEAQTRSKVSRVKADVRSLATGIESYYVDFNSYPAQDTGAGATSHSADATSNITLASPASGSGHPILNTPTFRVRAATENFMTLTTPVAYITSLFPDPFADSKPATFRYSVGEFVKSGWVAWSWGPDTDELQATNTTAGQAATDGFFITDTFYSPNRSVPTVFMILATYDPSNGTNSTGDVYRVKQ